MLCDHFQHRFPPERTFQLYRGLVRETENDLNNNTVASLARNERERMRVLEILGLTEKNIKSHVISSKIQPVDKPSYHLGSNARKRGVKTSQRRQSCQLETPQLKQQRTVESQHPLQFKRSRTLSQTSGGRKKSGMTRSIGNGQKSKTSFSNNISPKFNPAKNIDYVWHPIPNQKVSRSGKEKQRSGANKSVLSHYHNQYHKQTK